MIREYENLRELLEEQNLPVDEIFEKYPLMEYWSKNWKTIIAIDENKALRTGYRINYDDEYGFLLYSSSEIIIKTAYFLNRNCIIFRYVKADRDDYFIIFLKKDIHTKNLIIESLREAK